MSDLPDVLARHYAAFDSKDADADPWSADAEMVTPLGTCRGRDEILDFMKGFWAALPDSRHEITRCITEGPLVAVEGRLRGTHDGPFQTPAGEVPATGRPVDLRWMVMCELRGDELVHEQLYFDQMELMTQLGIAPGAPAETAAEAG
jgi:predicted ester cyclase